MRPKAYTLHPSPLVWLGWVLEINVPLLLHLCFQVVACKLVRPYTLPIIHASVGNIRQVRIIGALTYTYVVYYNTRECSRKHILGLT